MHSQRCEPYQICKKNIKTCHYLLIIFFLNLYFKDMYVITHIEIKTRVLMYLLLIANFSRQLNQSMPYICYWYNQQCNAYFLPLMIYKKFFNKLATTQIYIANVIQFYSVFHGDYSYRTLLLVFYNRTKDKYLIIIFKVFNSGSYNY